MRLGKLNKNTVLLLICALNIIILNFWSQDRKEAIQKAALESDILMHRMAAHYYNNDMLLYNQIVEANEEIEKVYRTGTERYINLQLSTRKLIAEKVKEYENAVPNLVKKTNPSVVIIEIPYRSFDQYAGEEKIRWGGGTGVVYDNVGHILSVAHITTHLENPDPTLPSPRIRFYDGRTQDILSASSADDFNYSSPGSADVGMIKVESTKNYPAIKLGNVNDVSCGQSIVVIGHPFMERYSVSTGVVSRVGFYKNEPRALLIQVDALINGGNSGGPVMGLDGRCYGVGSFRGHGNSGWPGLNFFVSTYVIKKWIPELLEELE